jgi:DNA-binding transcriptional ArsR family regulator
MSALGDGPRYAVLPLRPLNEMPPRSRTQTHVAERNAELFKALAHPVRHDVLILLSERVASPTEIVEELDASRDSVFYHVRELAKAKLIELVATDTRRGGTQHFYRGAVRPLLDVSGAERLSKLLREAGSVSILPRVLGDIIEAVEAGTFDASPARALLRQEVVYDEEGLRESGEAAVEYIDKLKDIEARSAARLLAAGDEGMRVATETLVFPLPDA